MATVTQLKPVEAVKPVRTKKIVKPKEQVEAVVVNSTKKEAKPSAKTIAKSKYQKYMSIALGSVAGALTAVSLTHLSHGVEMVTHCQSWEAWAMAVGIDLGFISLELASIVAPNVTELRKYASPTIIGTLVASAAMNAFCFTEHSETTVMQVGGVVLGVAIPVMIYCLTKGAAALHLNNSGK